MEALHQSSLQSLDGALRQSCTGFQGERFAKVLSWAPAAVLGCSDTAG